jgi:cytochrome oxidase Cu insertion factor (SCO1/SenC/PrrC family)
MSWRELPLPLALVFCLALGGCRRAENGGDDEEGPPQLADMLPVGSKAPDIEGTDADGKTFKLSDYRGKVVLLDFWDVH